jgi:hypothetical protein
MKLTLKGLQYYLSQVLYEGLDPTRIDDIFADSPEAQQFEAKLPGITDILKKNAAGGSYSVYTPPPVVTPPAVTDDTGAGAGAGTGVVTGDTGAGAGAGAGALLQVILRLLQALQFQIMATLTTFIKRILEGMQVLEN